MDVQKRNAIAYAVLKKIMKEKTRFSTIPDIKREAGNLAKETGFSPEEIVELAKIVLREAFDEQMGFLDGKPKYEE